MKTKFSTSWNSSKQPRKQRKYRYNAPLHIRGKFLAAHLSPELRKKYALRSLRVRKGDKVKVMRGAYKGREEKVEIVNVKREKVYLEKLTLVRVDGNTAKIPLNASNLMIIELELSDKLRKKKLESSNSTTPKLKLEKSKEIKKESIKKKQNEEL